MTSLINLYNSYIYFKNSNNIKDTVGFSWQLIHSLYQPFGDILVVKRIFKPLGCSFSYGCGTRFFIDHLVLSNRRHTGVD